MSSKVKYLADETVKWSGGTTIGDEPSLTQYPNVSDLLKFKDDAKTLSLQDHHNILRVIGMLHKHRGEYKIAFEYFTRAVDNGLPIIDDGIICKCYDNRSGHAPGRFGWTIKENSNPAQDYKSYAINFVEHCVTKGVCKSFVYLNYLYMDFYPVDEADDTIELERRIAFLDDNYLVADKIKEMGGMRDVLYRDSVFKHLLIQKYGSLIEMYRTLKNSAETLEDIKNYGPGSQESKKAEERFNITSKESDKGAKKSVERSAQEVKSSTIKKRKLSEISGLDDE